MNELLEIARNSNVVQHKVQDYSLLPAMPINNIDDLQTFDGNLQENEKMRHQFVSILKLHCILFIHN